MTDGRSSGAGDWRDAAGLLDLGLRQTREPPPQRHDGRSWSSAGNAVGGCRRRHLDPLGMPGAPVLGKGRSSMATTIRRASSPSVSG
jgi:hypothetical protein